MVIGIYERYLTVGHKWRETSQSAFSSISRRMKNMPILEHIVGTADLYDAIFDVEVSDDELNLFPDTDAEDEPQIAVTEDRDDNNGVTSPSLQPRLSRSSVRNDSGRPPSITVSGPSLSRSPIPGSRSPMRGSRTPLTPPSRGRRGGRDRTLSPGGSPRPRRGAFELPELIQTTSSAEIPSIGPRSPLSKLFSQRTRAESDSAAATAAAVSASAEGIRRIEGLVGDIKSLPINKLKDEMKELQVCVLVHHHFCCTLTFYFRPFQILCSWAGVHDTWLSS